MQDLAKNFLSTLLAVVTTLAAMHVFVTGPAERRNDQRLGRIEQRLDKIDDRFNTFERDMDARFREVDKRFDSLETTLDERVDKLETDLAITTRRLDWEQEQKQQE